jgi:hypothetical protein
MLDIFNASSGRSGSTDNKWPNFIVPETYNSGFGLQLMLNDMTLTPARKRSRPSLSRCAGPRGTRGRRSPAARPRVPVCLPNCSAVPWRQNYLPDKVKEFIYIAVDANATHMYLPGVRQHVKATLAAGATDA